MVGLSELLKSASQIFVADARAQNFLLARLCNSYIRNDNKQQALYIFAIFVLCNCRVHSFPAFREAAYHASFSFYFLNHRTKLRKMRSPML